jgi:hypothetical protein
MLHTVFVVEVGTSQDQASRSEFQSHVEQMAGEDGRELKDCSMVTGMGEPLHSGDKTEENLVVACLSLQVVIQPVEMAELV